MRGRIGAAVVALGLMVACGDSPTTVEFQVIEETTFAASLDIDLSAMDRLDSGVYIEDLVEGAADTVFFATTPAITYTGWLSDGTEFDSGQFSFLMGNSQVVPGFEDGLLYARVGGTRKVIIPPNRGYGGLTQYVPSTGAVLIPGGSILVFEITVDSLITP